MKTSIERGEGGLFINTVSKKYSFENVKQERIGGVCMLALGDAVIT